MLSFHHLIGRLYQTLTTRTIRGTYILEMEGCGLIVETRKNGECTCHFDDSACVGRTAEDIDSILQALSALVISCLRKRKAA